MDSSIESDQLRSEFIASAKALFAKTQDGLELYDIIHQVVSELQIKDALSLQPTQTTLQLRKSVPLQTQTIYSKNVSTPKRRVGYNQTPYNSCRPIATQVSTPSKTTPASSKVTPKMTPAIHNQFGGLLDKYFSKREPSPPLPIASPTLKKVKVTTPIVEKELSEGKDDEDMVDMSLEERQLQPKSLSSTSDEEVEEGKGQVQTEVAPRTILRKRVVVPIPLLREILEIGPNEYPR